MDSHRDHLTPEECYLGDVAHLETVPQQHRAKWAEIYSTILDKVIVATTEGTEEEGTRALKWQMAIHHLFLRTTRRGNTKVKQGNRRAVAEMDRRYRLWQDKILATLVEE